MPNEYIWCCKLRLNNYDEFKNIPYINEITVDGQYIYMKLLKKIVKNLLRKY